MRMYVEPERLIPLLIAVYVLSFSIFMLVLQNPVAVIFYLLAPMATLYYMREVEPERYTLPGLEDDLEAVGYSLEGVGTKLLLGLFGLVTLLAMSAIGGTQLYVPNFMIALQTRVGAIPATVLAVLFHAVLVAPSEEMLFRRFLHEALQPYVGLWGAALCVAAAFSLMHIPAWGVVSAPLMAMAFAASLLFTALYKATGEDLTAPTFAHAVYNVLAQLALFGLTAVGGV